MFLDDFMFGGSGYSDRGSAAFDFYYYYLIYFLCIVYYISTFKSFDFWPKWFLYAIVVIFSSSFFAATISGYITKFGMYKQIIGITYSSAAFYCMFKIAEFNLKSIFKMYLAISIWVAAYGVFEEIASLMYYPHWFGHFKVTAAGYYRVYSIMGEPYFLAITLTPALFYYSQSLFGRSTVRNFLHFFYFAIIILCIVFTFSTAGYMSVAFVGIMVFYSRGWMKYFLFLFLLASPYLDLSKIGIFEIQVRINDSKKAFLSKDKLSKKEIGELNSSSFALYSNFLIAQESFVKRPLTGTGLGTHEYTYNTFFEKLLGKEFMIRFGKFNQKDANSLFIRLMSETGLIGLVLVFFFFIKFFLRNKGIEKDNLAYLNVINQGAFILFFIRIIRTGNYISQGFFFFFFLYYYSAIQVREELKASKPNGKE